MLTEKKQLESCIGYVDDALMHTRVA